MSNVLKLPTTKCCNACKQFLPFSYFSKNSSMGDKLSTHCKECDKVRQDKSKRKTNPQRLAYARKYQLEKRQDFKYRLQMLINASKQRAKLKNIEHEITVEDLIALYPLDGKCPVLGVELEFGSAGFRENSPSIDKINPNKGYTKDNIQVISWRANRIKGDATLEELELLVAYLKQGDK